MYTEGLTLMPVEQSETAASPEQIRRIIREELCPHFTELARLGSTAELLANPLYRRLRPHADLALSSPETGEFGPAHPGAKDSYRLVGWNLERGIHCDAQLEALKSHPHLAEADVLLLTETDVGMARSGNRNVARDMAQALGMHYAFSPCYLNLAKGSGVEYDVAGENDLGLHGNAILSRYPLRNVRAVALKNGKDKMKGREKRLGRQTAVVVDVELPQGPVGFAAVHLDANSSQRHRRDQMRDVLDGLGPDAPAVVGGDWNTTTYDSSTAANAILGFWLRVLMGPDNVIRNHYLHPYQKFERDLFALLEERAFDYRSANAMGVRTTSYDVDDAKTHKNLREWAPAWCFAFIRWALRNHDGKCPLKIDWFAVRGLRAFEPRVFHEFREGRRPPLSDHDPIAVDVAFDESARRDS